MISFHSGASWVPGTGILHISGTHLDLEELAIRWRLLENRQLTRSSLNIERDRNGGITASGSLKATVPFDLAKEIFTKPLRHLRGATFTRALDQQRLRSSFFESSFGHYERHAVRRGWVYQIEMFEAMPVHVFGIGRYIRIMISNMHEDVKPPIVFAGRDKAFGRSLLASYALPIAPGAVVRSPADAVATARRLGYPVVLKGIASGDSDEVLSQLRDDASCRDGARELLRRGSAIIVEKFVHGPQYRLQYINGSLRCVFQCVALKVLGDGSRSLLDLLRRQYPTYADIVLADPARRRRMVYLTWYLGVRSIQGLSRIRPAKGEAVPISAATGHGVMRVCSRRAIRLEDRRAIERMLRDCGNPSAAIDLALSTEGARLSDGGAIFEINAPCGFSYLPEAQQCVAAELDSIVSRVPGFVRNGGRVPFWMILKQTISADDVLTVKRHFRAHYPRGREIEVNRNDRWINLLSDRSADAFLAVITEEAIGVLGMPANLKPRCLHSGRATLFRRTYPRVYATVKNAGGVLRAINKLPAT